MTPALVCKAMRSCRKRKREYRISASRHHCLVVVSEAEACVTPALCTARGEGGEHDGGMSPSIVGGGEIRVASQQQRGSDAGRTDSVQFVFMMARKIGKWSSKRPLKHEEIERFLQELPEDLSEISNGSDADDEIKLDDSSDEYKPNQNSSSSDSTSDSDQLAESEPEINDLPPKNTSNSSKPAKRRRGNTQTSLMKCIVIKKIQLQRLRI